MRCAICIALCAHFVTAKNIREHAVEVQAYQANLQCHRNVSTLLLGTRMIHAYTVDLMLN